MPTEANAINSSSAGIVGNTGTGFTSNSITQHNVLVGGASNAISSVAPGTSGNVLTSNGTDWTSAAPASSGALVQLATHTASNSANIDFTSNITGTYNTYLLTFTNLVPVTDQADLHMLVSTDNGSTFSASGYTSGTLHVAYNSASLGNSNSTTFFYVTVGQDVTSGYASGQIWMSNNSATFQMHGLSSEVHGGINFSVQVNGTNTATSVNAIRLIYSSGNISSGVFTLYGLSGS